MTIDTISKISPLDCTRELVQNAVSRVKGIKFCFYCRMKAYAQGMLDIALLTVNAAHLTHVLKQGSEEDFYYFNLSLLGVSIVLQISIAILIFIKERYDIDDEKQHPIMDILNNLLVFLVFTSTVIHVFLSVFIDEHEVPGHGSSHGKCQNCSHH